jgi:Ca2+-binding EF-hand superfamily protein
MFSPVGKKQILLEIKRAKETGLDLQEAREIVLARKQDELNEKSMGSPGAQVSPDKSKRSTAGKKDEDGMGTSKLNQLLSDKGLEGTVMRKVMDATVRYNPEKDQIVLKSFQNKFIEPELFRDILYKAFWLGFSDKEFNAMLDILDPSDSGYIDGYQFMIAFIRLGGIRKEKAAEKIRLGNEAFTIKMKEEEAKKKMELEKKNEIAADFDFDDEVKNQAMKKLTIAASKFDPSHPSSPSLEAFNGKYMSAAVLREMLKRVFNLKVSGKELGAILMNFEAKDLVEAQDKALGVSTAGVQTRDVSDGVKQVTVPASGGGAAEGGKDAETIAVKTGPSQISCNDFLRQFFRLGVETRDKTARNQRQRQLELDKLAAEEKARKIKEAEEKKSMAIDFDFSELDVARADTKLLEASTKYDRNAPGCGSLEGFECESLSVGTFRDLVRRAFGLVLSDKELGYVIRKYDKKGDQTITCKAFLNAFLRIGQDERDKRRLKQLDKQRKLDELASLEAEQKMKEIQEKSSNFKINYDFTDADADSAKAKLTEAAVWFDKSRGGSLASFEQLFLSPLEFHRALKRTFNIIMTPAELGAVVTMMDTEGKGHVVSKQFINSFTAMGFQERSSKSLKQIKKSQAAEKKMREEAEAKRLALLNKNPGVDIDYEYTEDDRDIALLKMTEAACRYDKAHPAAMSLDGFECKALTPIAFKDLMRSTFNLRLTPKDAGALIDHFATLRDGSNDKEIISRDFLTVFLQLGYQQRAALNTEQIQKQRRMIKEQAERDAEMLKKTTERADGLKINMNFVEADAVSCQAKLLGAAKGYDKNHPAAPSLDAFDIAVMPAGIFRENMKRCFNVKLNPSELGYCIVTYGDKQKMEVESPSFLTKFLRMGKAARYEEQTAFLKKQRKMIKEAKYQEEKKLKDQAEGAEFKVDLSDFKDTDLETALDKMTMASTKFHEPMSSVKGFTGGPMKPGEFRDLVRRSFGLALNPQETASLVNYLNADPKNRTSDCIDSKAFCILFMKLGHQNRAAMKNDHAERQRQATQDMEKEKVRKKRLQEQKMVTDIDWGYGEVDRTSIYKKVTEASAKYDKNAPGCVSLTAFEAKFLTPLVFREVMKRTFNIACSPKELAVLVSDFDNGDGNLHCQNFVVYVFCYTIVLPSFLVCPLLHACIT